jgi:RNA polymerase sigma factor for flagellar operon FliA
VTSTRPPSAREALWQRYHDTGDAEARAELLSQHLGLVHHAVRQIAGRVGDAVGLEDLIGAGCLGLLRAFEGFDPSLGVAFTTYATQRIRGTVLDELRSADRLPRNPRAQARAVQRATNAVAQRLGRKATPGEVAAELSVDLPTYWEWFSLAESGATVSLDTPRAGDDHTMRLADQLPDPNAAVPGATLELADQRTLVREAIADLPEQQRVVLALCYDEGLSLRQIAEVLHVTESRISQVRSAALRALRARLAENA